MEYTITFTPESVANFLNAEYGEYFGLNVTVSQVEEHWESFERYFDNLKTNGFLSECIWDDFPSVAEEWEIPFFDEDFAESN